MDGGACGGSGSRGCALLVSASTVKLRRYEVPIRARLQTEDSRSLFVLAENPTAARDFAEALAARLFAAGGLMVVPASVEVMEPLQVSKDGPVTSSPGLPLDDPYLASDSLDPVKPDTGARPQP